MEKIRIVAVSRTISADTLTPIGLYQRLKQWREPFFLLESMGEDRDLGRYSYIGMNPIPLQELVGPFTLKNADAALQRIAYQGAPGRESLLSGIVGTLSYDAVEELFPLELTRRSSLPAHQFYLAGTLAVLDPVSKELVLVQNLVAPDAAALRAAEDQLYALEQQLCGPTPAEALVIPKASVPLTFRSSFTHRGFTEAVARIQQHIFAGDIFQAVLSQRFTAQGELNGFDLYRHLRRTNPAPYMVYLKFPGFEALCSSPEMLVRTGGGTIETVPIAGTRPILRDGRDEERAQQLLADEKERAEHLMLVDLGRNDIGKVAAPGSVEVSEYCQVRHFAAVMHLVSRVKGRLAPGVGPIGGLSAAFPAGTVTGAPKLRAMQILDSVEPVPRGLYAGSVVIMDPAGRLNSCIAIRTITLQEGTVTLQTGAGIVHDSVPEAEYQETMNKAKALFDALEAYTDGGVTYDFDD